MEEGWEEFIALGSWIGHRAGAGGKLNKHGGVDEAAENEKRAGKTAEGNQMAGGAAAVQTNCIQLMSGTTVTLNFLKKSMPRMGPATFGLQKTRCKTLPWNCTVF
jgi:hypothetical protein